MVEGQSGLTWPRWQRICLAAESLGFAALYRSDHLVSAQPAFSVRWLQQDSPHKYLTKRSLAGWKISCSSLKNAFMGP